MGDKIITTEPTEDGESIKQTTTIETILSRKELRFQKKLIQDQIDVLRLKLDFINASLAKLT
jgi:hypothetical protein